MAVVFSRTLRSLHADRFRGYAIGTVVATVLLALWAVWFFLGRVSLYEVSTDARLVVRQAAHPLEAPVSGQVVAAHLNVGASVTAGDVLVELDDSTDRLLLAEAEARLDRLTSELRALRLEKAAIEASHEEARQAATVAMAEARARQNEAEAAAQFAAEQVAHVKELRAAGNATEMEERRAVADAAQRRFAAEAAALAVEVLQRTEQSAERQREAERESLQRQIESTEGELATTRATIERLHHTIRERKISAPISGELGDVVDLRPGSFLREGQRFGAIVPPGDVKLTAEFTAAAAIGRIQPGQKARLRLAGFPWSQYGSVLATVTSVAQEVRGGRIQVQFDLDKRSAANIPLQHGLPGVVEVEVEQVSPAVLVLRSIGGTSAPPAAPTDEPQIAGAVR